MAPEAKPADQNQPTNSLPVSLTGPIDIGRLIREIEALDEQLIQLGLRKQGQPTDLPKTSRLLEETAQLNKFNLLQAEDRKQLRNFLTMVTQQAPVLHISFGADPSPLFLERLMTWLRREIHPQALLTVGLQLNLGAGCVLRTTNKYFDCSLRQDFASNHDLLRAAIAAPVKEAHQ